MTHRGLRSGGRSASRRVEAAPAATVVLLRDGDDGLEVLLGKRSSKLKFHGGAWVFPGGRIDPEDYGDDPADLDAAARRAAAREAKEEAGVDVDPDALVHFSNWTTPDISPKRFATWFFVGPVAGGTAIADGAETDKIQWFGPDEALAAHAAGEIELAPPQHVSLLDLRAYATVADAMAAHRGRDADRLPAALPLRRRWRRGVHVQRGRRVRRLHAARRGRHPAPPVPRRCRVELPPRLNREDRYLLGWGVSRRYGFTVFQPFGNFSLASSSEMAGAMITSSPSFQFTGVDTL